MNPIPWALLASLALPALAATAPAPSLTARIEQAALAQLVRQADAAGLREPEFNVTLAGARAAPACSKPVAIEVLDARTPARMRFAALCPDSGGWRYEYVVRAGVTAMVAVTAAPVAPGQLLTAADLALERRDISAVADSFATVEAASGQASRRTLRAGELLRQSQLAAPLLVKRGDTVTMVARHEQVMVSTAGEALDGGAGGAVVRVRNANGQVVRMRVSGAGMVEPIALIR